MFFNLKEQCTQKIKIVIYSITQSFVVPNYFFEILSEGFSGQSFIIIHVNKHRGTKMTKKKKRFIHLS